MARSAKDVYRDALALSEEEREELVWLLTATSDRGFASPEIEQSWVAEVRRRQRSRAQGKTGTVDGDEVFQQVRRILDE